MKFQACSSKPPIGSLITLKALQVDGVTVEWGKETLLSVSPEIEFKTDLSVCRYLARRYGKPPLYGSTIVQHSEIDHWLTFSIGALEHNNFEECLSYLDKSLATVTYLVGDKCSIADFVVWGGLYNISKWHEVMKKGEAPSNIARWYSLVGNMKCVTEIISSLPESKKVKAAPKGNTLEGLRKEEGKFVDLPDAEMGKVVVRFPPEASGYLHIGHAKAALLNQYYKEIFNGKLIMRFDDTNPAKEKVDFEKVILEDLKLLEITPDEFTHTSNYFDLMLEMCERLIKEGKAYVDDTDPETMKKEREQKLASNNRKNTVEKNLEMWEEMKKGSEKGQKSCVRAKIDMNSPNGCMRDPTIYRCKNELHPRTGDKYKVYPTYDFACPIVDSIEGVTHCLRTMEYHDRDEQFFWFIEALGLRKPHIWEYARLNMTNTVLSKRKLTWFVDEKLVDGWDDPRFPTVRGVIRRGMTVEGLKQFVIAQGSSRSVVVMEWDKIWSFNKKVIDPVAPRYTAVHATDKVPVLVSSVSQEAIKVPKHPKNSDIGEKTIWIGPNIIVDRADAEEFKEGTNVTFINWGNLKINKIVREDGEITQILAEPNLDDKDYKKTLKITWLAEIEKAPLIPCVCVYFEHIISKPVLGKDEDFKQYIGHSTRLEVEMVGDQELANVQKSDIIQLQRKGFFICDRPYNGRSLHTGRTSPIILFAIPDGRQQATPCAPSKPASQDKSLTKKTEPDNTKSASTLNTEIKSQGDVIRDLKQKKADKSVITAEVDKLLKLKGQFKQVFGQEWKPDLIIESQNPPEPQIQKRESTGTSAELDSLIKAQGDTIRDLKQKKAEKSIIGVEVDKLLNLKAQFKEAYGLDWKPDLKLDSSIVASAVPSPVVKTEETNHSLSDLNLQIKAQGDVIRELKQKKTEKSIITVEVEKLLKLKAQFKSMYGQEWKPDIKLGGQGDPKIAPKEASNDIVVTELLDKITEVGNKIRKLKSEKADKNVIAEEVKALLELKATFKTLTGQDWKPGMDSKNEGKKPGNGKNDKKSPETEKTDEKSQKIVNTDRKSSEKDKNVEKSAIMRGENSDKGLEITQKVKEQGDKVRQLKSSGVSKEEIDKAVQVLLSLKMEYKTITGTDYPAEGKASKKEGPKEKQSKPAKQKKQVAEPNKDTTDSANQIKKITRLGLEAKKAESLPDWYSQVITKGEMIEYFDVSGCYILRPWSFEIWEKIKDWFDSEIKKLGVKNCYFPIFVSKSVLEKEKTHIADFAPEVAWVTKSGDSDLAEPIAIRPTSETVMYPAYAKWVQSYRDLPIKLNQWNNVVRWEFKHPQPFLRTREFLWQEGHTAYASMNEAVEEVHTILDLYAKIYTDLLAIPVVKGRKTEKEKFAGGDFTLTVEAYISASGRAIQGATSHHLGQNFSKMFEIIFDDPVTQEKSYVYQNSWGITTRTIGVVIMVHGDDQGLVLPPRVAAVQAVIVPCGLTTGLPEADRQGVLDACKHAEEALSGAGVRVHADYRENYSPGWKFNHWELKGVPLRIEVGPKDVKLNQVLTVRRDNGTKETISNDTIVDRICSVLETIHSDMLGRASSELNAHMVVCKQWKEFCNHLDKKNIVMAPFCGEIPCEEWIKKNSAREDTEDSGAPSMGAKGLCIPFDQPNGGITEGDKCIDPECTLKPKYYTLFGRSY